MNGRIGFCGQWVSSSNDSASELLMNQKSTTIAALSRLSKSQATERLLGLVRNNLDTLNRLVGWVGALPQEQRLLRMTSDILPAYTHEVASWVYGLPVMREVMENGFNAVGDTARALDVRLSFHPGQYCIINTVKEGVLLRAIQEFEYHTDMMRMMGYGGSWHKDGALINIHVGSRAGGISGFKTGLRKLSNDARNLITVENDEYSFGLTDLEGLAEHCPIVLDIHHEWIYSKGQFITPDDPRIEYVKESWRGVRPLGHFSTSRQEALKDEPDDALPDFQSLRQRKLTLRDLRAHSDDCWSPVANDWALSHLSWMDIEVEAKKKNIASEQLYQQYKKNKQF